VGLICSLHTDDRGIARLSKEESTYLATYFDVAFLPCVALSSMLHLQCAVEHNIIVYVLLTLYLRSCLVCLLDVY